MKHIRWLIVIALALPAFIPRQTSAQGQCESFTFPSGWTISTGTNAGDYVAGVDTTRDGIAVKRVAVQKVYSSPITINSVQVDWSFIGFADDYLAVLTVTLFDGSTPIATRVIQRDPGFGWYTGDVLTFPSVSADGVLVTLEHRRDGAHGGNPIGLRVSALCSYNVVTATPSPTVQIDTSTPIPTSTQTSTPQTSTPTPSETATQTFTATVTDTPGGPTGSPTPSRTATSSVTPTRAGISSGGFNTPQKPKACTDPFNPCGALPFPVPGFATVSLSSPTAVPSVTQGPTTTFVYQTATATGTGGGGGGSTPTPSNFGVAIIGIATQVEGWGLGFEPTFNDADNNAVDLRNAANQIGSTMGQFWAFVRQLPNLFIGKAGLIVAFMILILAFSMALRVFLFVYAVLQFLWKQLMRLLEAAKSAIIGIAAGL